MSRLKELFLELRYHLRMMFVMRTEAVKLRLAIYLSDIKQKARNRRFHVVLMQVGNNENGEPITRLRSIDNQGFKYCKRKGWLPKRMTMVELEQKAFYSTPLSRNNTEKYDARKRAMRKYMRYQKVINKMKL